MAAFSLVCRSGLLRGLCVAACPSASAGPSLLPVLPLHHSEGAEAGKHGCLRGNMEPSAAAGENSCVRHP